MSPTISSLARLTLRQLRQIASDLGVPLYSRKSKETLVDEVAVRQEKRGGDLKAIEAELNAPAISTTETRVVFLPRDPQWAYVFWEISDSDRQRAQKGRRQSPVFAPSRRDWHARRQCPPPYASGSSRR